MFTNGEERKYIMIEIYNDDVAEPDETFEVILANPKNGAILGTPSRGIIYSELCLFFLFFCFRQCRMQKPIGTLI